jgi:protein-disulfide isomerase
MEEFPTTENPAPEPPAIAPAAPPAIVQKPPAPAGPNWAMLAFAAALGALLTSGLTWYRTDRAIAELKNAQTAQNAPLIDLAGQPVLGSDTATVALVEFSDYECPFCLRHFTQTMPRILADYVKTGKILYAFRDWPVDELHPQSVRAHEAAHCAREQNKYWEIHQRLFAPAGSHSPEQLFGLARELGLDMASFTACIESKRSDPSIRANGEMATQLGADGTPSFFVGLRQKGTNKVSVTQTISGAQDYSVFAKSIDAALAQAR